MGCSGCLVSVYTWSFEFVGGFRVALGNLILCWTCIVCVYLFFRVAYGFGRYSFECGCGHMFCLLAFDLVGVS